MYQDRSDITNPTLQSWAHKLSNLQPEQIGKLIDAPALPVPDNADLFLKKQQ